MQRLLDLTGEQEDPPQYNPAKHRIVQGKVQRRRPQDVDGIVVHQTACQFGTTPAQVRAAEGDAALAKHRRALQVAAHVTAFKTGVAVVGNPLDWYVYNANALNRRILGLEIEGQYPGLLAAATKTPDKFEGEIEQAAQAGLRYLVEQGRRMGMPIRYVWAHRQSSNDRRGDPGEEIWRKLVLNFAVPVLGLETRNDDIVIEGRCIPRQWSPTGHVDF